MSQSKFIEIPATKRSKCILVYGVGVNDADYITQPIIKGKQLCCPYYAKWREMLRRCYSVKFHKRNKTYEDCLVVDEWLAFSNFKTWMDRQDWVNKQLDKDIIKVANKVYSPDTCLFVPRALNALFNDRRSARGDYPIGVNWDKSNSKFMAQININAKKKNLGRFKTVEEASDAYQKARKEKIHQLITDNTYPMATQYLAQHMNLNGEID